MLRNYSSSARPVQLSADVDASSGLWPVTSTLGYPDPPFTLGAERGTAKEEFALCTAKASDSFTVERGFDGTDPIDHDAGVSIEHCSGAIDFREASAHINDPTSHTTICTETTKPEEPILGQHIWCHDTGKGYTWTGLGTAYAHGWLPDPGTLLWYSQWDTPTPLQFSDVPHGIGHDLPFLAQWMMPALPKSTPGDPFDPSTGHALPGWSFYDRRVKIEFFMRSWIFDSSSSEDEILIAQIKPASPLSFGGSFQSATNTANLRWGPSYQDFCYIVCYMDNKRIPAGPAGAKVSLFSPTGRTGASAVYWDDPLWMAVSMA